jgi:hypothetical protein
MMLFLKQHKVSGEPHRLFSPAQDLETFSRDG